MKVANPVGVLCGRVVKRYIIKKHFTELDFVLIKILNTICTTYGMQRSAASYLHILQEQELNT